LRFALSALAGIAGLLLLAGAILGQPQLYVSQARQQWGALFGSSHPDPEADALALQVAQLRQQTAQLNDQLAASRTAADKARQELAALQQQRPLVAPPDRPDPDTSQTPLVTAPERREVLTVPDRREALKAPPSPLPLPKPKAEAPPARFETDNAQSVLARLRQRPGTAPLPVDTPPPAEPPRPSPPSPSRQRLELARLALINGRIDDARRLLQEVQLQLVFRPVGPGVEDAPSAGQGASDVARALGALSSNDRSQSQRYIERAMDAVAGTSPQVVESAPGPVPGGYAPAYPSR
jgi:hypothetical protein